VIPIRDDIPSSTTPWVNYIIIGLCTIVFLIQLSKGDDAGKFAERYGMVPARVSHPHSQIMVEETYIQRLGPRFVRPVWPWA
jgi:membrane associated rhomboid family serine protease